MAHLEIVNFTPMKPVVSLDEVLWKIDRKLQAIPDLPQIFWSNGNPWSEANLWALIKCTQGSKVQTVASLMSHLAAYADWLEQTDQDWMASPKRVGDSALARYRSDLLRMRKMGAISPSTATARMRALIQFYNAFGLDGQMSPISEKQDFPLSMDRTQSPGHRTRSDLAIANTVQREAKLEDGTLAMTQDQVLQLMRFTVSEGLEELNLILSLGFLSGARSITITSLKEKDVLQAKPVPGLRSIYQIRVGPRTDVPTKDDIPGDLYVPKDLLEALKTYARSQGRAERQTRSRPEFRDLLFLAPRGNSYKFESFNRLITQLRRRCINAGLLFMASFKFQQTRCTFGVWLMRLTLGFAEKTIAIGFVCSAMQHRTEAITQRYFRHLRQSDCDVRVPAAFSSAYDELAKLPVFRRTHFM